MAVISQWEFDHYKDPALVKNIILQTIRSGSGKDILSNNEEGGSFEHFIAYLESHHNIAEEIPLMHALQCWVEKRLKDHHISGGLDLASDCINIAIVFAAVQRIPEAIEWLGQAERCVNGQKRSFKKDHSVKKIITKIYTEQARLYQLLGEEPIALAMATKAEHYR